MDGCFTIMVTLAIQIYHHGPVPGNPFVTMVELLDFVLYLILLGIVSPFAMLFIIIVGIRAYAESSQQPAYTKFIMILIDKPISL